jgi:hypothetical protein
VVAGHLVVRHVDGFSSLDRQERENPLRSHHNSQTRPSRLFVGRMQITPKGHFVTDLFVLLSYRFVLFVCCAMILFVLCGMIMFTLLCYICFVYLFCVE